MNRKKILAVASGVIVLATFILFVVGEVRYVVFLIVAILNAIFAYKILPKMK